MLEKYYQVNKAVGVAIHTDANSNIAINACSLTVQNNQLNFEKKVIDIENAEGLKKHFPEKSVIALNLSGKGVLTRQLTAAELDVPNSFTKVLPNANPDDFYVQTFISGDQAFVSLIRKTDADKWIDQLVLLGFLPLMLSLGPFPVNHIIPQLNVYGNELVFNGNIIQRDEQGNWLKYQYDENAKSPFALKVELEGIDEKLLAPYAAAFQLLLAAKLDAIHATVPSLDTAYTQKLNESKLKVWGFITLAALFLLLLINFVLFSWLDSSNAQLAGRVSRTAQSSNDIQGINDQIKQKEGLLDELGWESGINKSALVDQIASMLPPELTWKEVAIDPMDLPSTRIQKTLTFYTRRIRITGNSEKIIPVNEWMARVKTKPWVKNIQLESFTYNSELNTGQFTILIDY